MTYPLPYYVGMTRDDTKTVPLLFRVNGASSRLQLGHLPAVEKSGGV